MVDICHFGAWRLALEGSDYQHFLLDTKSQVLYSGSGWVSGHQQARLEMIHRRKRQLTLGDVIKVVSHFSHDDHETSLVVADLINRGLIKLRGPYKHTKVTVP
jgi:hypothetical protein